RFRVGLSLAVLHDISQERRKKRHQPRGLNFSWRRVVRRSTTNCFSLSAVFFTLTISLIKNVSRETLLQSTPCVSRETLAMMPQDIHALCEWFKRQDQLIGGLVGPKRS